MLLLLAAGDGHAPVGIDSLFSAKAAIALVTLLSAPVDVMFGRRAVKRSWHAVFVLQRTGGNHAN